ncbi:MAG: serine protease [bacterium]
MNLTKNGVLCGVMAVVMSATTGTAQDTANIDSFPDIVAEVRRSVALVKVKTDIKNVFALGTAFILKYKDDKAYLASAYHTFFEPIKHEDTVVISDTSRVEIMFDSDNSFRPAHVVFTRKSKDIALVTVDIPLDSLQQLGLLALSLGKVKTIREGASVASTGYNFLQRTVDFGQWRYWPTTYKGIISSVRAISPEGEPPFIDRFQVDLPLNQGASGSPVYLTSDKTVVGMFNKFATQESGDATVPVGLAYCIPSWAIHNCLADYLKELQNSDTTSTSKD